MPLLSAFRLFARFSLRAKSNLTIGYLECGEGTCAFRMDFAKWRPFSLAHSGVKIAECFKIMLTEEQIEFTFSTVVNSEHLGKHELFVTGKDKTKPFTTRNQSHYGAFYWCCCSGDPTAVVTMWNDPTLGVSLGWGSICNACSDVRWFHLNKYVLA